MVPRRFRILLRGMVTLALMAFNGCADSGSGGGFSVGTRGPDPESATEHPVLGDWERTIVLGYVSSTGVANTQVDRYIFHPDGTFDHHRHLDFLAISSGQSGLWREDQGRIICEAELEIESRAYRDLLLLSADGTELMDLANRARGVPPYRRPAVTQPAFSSLPPAVTVPVGDLDRQR